MSDDNTDTRNGAPDTVAVEDTTYLLRVPQPAAGAGPD